MLNLCKYDLVTENLDLTQEIINSVQFFRFCIHLLLTEICTSFKFLTYCQLFDVIIFDFVQNIVFSGYSHIEIISELIFKICRNTTSNCTCISI